jgi:hypothetical protein
VSTRSSKVPQLALAGALDSEEVPGAAIGEVLGESELVD